MFQGGGHSSLRLSITQPIRNVANVGIQVFQRHPFLVKTLSSGVGFAFGDGITQLLTRRDQDPYDWQRTIKMGASGLAIAGPLGYLFIIWMEGNVMPNSPLSRLAISTKVTLDQVLGGVLWQLAFLAIHEPYRAAALDLGGKVKKDLHRKFFKPDLVDTKNQRNNNKQKRK